MRAPTTIPLNAIPALYVASARRLVDRRAYCERVLTVFEASPRWIDELASGQSWRRLLQRVGSVRRTRGEISIHFIQTEILRRIALGDEPWAMVFEDDPVFPRSFVSTFTKYWTARPSEFDLIFFGASCDLERAATDPSHLYAHETGTRSASAYVVTRRAATILATELSSDRITQPVDLQMNEIIRRHKLSVYWSCPALIENGSEKGLFPRSVGRSRAFRYIRGAFRRRSP